MGERQGIGLVLDAFFPSIKRGCPEGTGVCGIVKLSNGSLNKCGRIFVREATSPLISPQGGTSGGKTPSRITGLPLVAEGPILHMAIGTIH